MSEAQRIRDHIIQKHIDPAKKLGLRSVDVISGMIAAELTLKERMPSICAVMKGRILSDQAGVTIEKISLTPSGTGSTVSYRYSWNNETTAAPTGMEQYITAKEKSVGNLNVISKKIDHSDSPYQIIDAELIICDGTKGDIVVILPNITKEKRTLFIKKADKIKIKLTILHPTKKTIFHMRGSYSMKEFTNEHGRWTVVE